MNRMFSLARLSKAQRQLLPGARPSTPSVRRPLTQSPVGYTAPVYYPRIVSGEIRESGNKVSITAITPTGDRPLAFSLCRKWMMNQTVQPDQWVVVDDGKVALEWGDQRSLKSRGVIEYVRREPQPNDPKHTLCLNVATMLPWIRGDKILVIEDDEYYAPNYIEEMSLRLDSYEVVGIMRAKYYHLPTGRYVINGNTNHASFAESAFRASFLPRFSAFFAKGITIDWLDAQMWQWVNNSKRTSNPISSLLFIDSAEPLYLGIKGLPGRKGIGVGHDPSTYPRHRDGAARGAGWQDDPNRTVLKQWVPKDYQTYLDVLAGMK